MILHLRYRYINDIAPQVSMYRYIDISISEISSLKFKDYSAGSYIYNLHGVASSYVDS